jgi:hypothetical protein
MKLKKFNESSGFYSEQVVRDILSDYNILLDKTYDYFIYKLPDIDSNLDPDEITITSVIFSIKDGFIILYSDGYDYSNSYNFDDEDEFIAFLNDPKLVKNSKNYNL